MRVIVGIIALIGTFAGCSSEPPAATTLAGTSWRLVSLQSMDDQQGTTTVPPTAEYTVSFGDDGSATFQINCNRGRSSFEATPSDPAGDEPSGSLTFGEIALTMMACVPPALDQEVSTALPNVRTYLIRGGKLNMSQKFDSGILTWEPLSPAE
ncbi:Uncharacterised protein [Mycolicibacterium vanbaalenii]|uniref:DUF306 domain-containing protein n=1 Tax=Mycolicibacterium vanbaalenii TaxID=110539 RepID=A0A5S9R904_MYCVN|nr:META domain-containing protein [Mycolicibacterium vanbaalenii]CAA0136492.1 Uncharacterised protein [Mycolicibacterium vanbaalenii]